MDKQQINMMAAKLCGKVPLVLLGEQGPAVVVEYDKPWDIFADTPQGAWNREQADAALAEYGISICSDDHGRFFLWFEPEQAHVGDFATRKEARTAAVEYASKDAQQGVE